MNLDNLESLSVKKQLTDFPVHFHETFCFTLIRNGIEKTEFNGHSVYGQSGQITIAQPYEVHANPIVDKNLSLEFDTIYISPDLMKYLMQGNVDFLIRSISNVQLNGIFVKLKTAIDKRQVKLVEQLLFEFALHLKNYSRPTDTIISTFHSFDQFDHVTSYIEHHLRDKLNLDELARIANMSKFCFARKFKGVTGMSPINFCLMKKIFTAKSNISELSDLTDIAYSYNFSDLAHFSKTFKRYVGISPKAYQHNMAGS